MAENNVGVIGGGNTDDFRDLWELIENDQGIHVTTMRQLRDRFEYGRLGVNVCSEIASTLASWGIGVFPAELPARQNVPVRLYRKGTPIAELVEAVLAPTNEGDDLLRRVGVDNTTGVIDQIRLLVA